MEIIQGVNLLRQRVHADARGELVALEQFTSLPFVAKRVFFLNVDAPSTVRGGHANSCDELIIAVRGSVMVDVDNGREHAMIRLERNDQALWIQAGIVIRLREFGLCTSLLVFASELYADTRHFDEAQPDLMMASCSA